LPAEIASSSQALVLSEGAAPAVVRVGPASTEPVRMCLLAIPEVVCPSVRRVEPVCSPHFGTSGIREADLGIVVPRVRPVPGHTAVQLQLERRRQPMAAAAGSHGLHDMPSEIALLREVSGEPGADIKLIGVYCSIPVMAASRLELDPSTGALMINLRENAAQVAAASKRPVVTLILGQIVSTGKMVRAIR
jgi:hypothetical protein